MIKDIKKIILPSMFIILSGCASKIPTMEELEPFQVGEIEYSKNDTSDGSIYNSGNNSLLIGVGKRYQVGDIINILMSESIDAKDSVKSKTDQKTSHSAGLGLALPNGRTDFDGDFSLKSNKKVEGTGSSSQSHSLTGSIATTVTQVYPNGVLEIKGVKQVTLEKGVDTIAITGRIREQDVSTTNNEVLSDKVANAKMYYKGSGHIYEKSSEGWLLNAIGGVFWPF